MKKLFLIALCTVLLLSACRRFGAESETARVDRLFVDWDRKDTPGCAVGISDNGAIVYEHGYGMANLELGVPITKDTVFAIASITKSFTATSVMLAAQQGKLSLDDEVQKYVPDWQDRDDHVTIRHLLTHTSGLRDAFGLLGWAEPSESAGDQNEAIVGMLARQRGLNFPPGAEYQYNNGGYNLLASILKRARGQSLGEFADSKLVVKAVGRPEVTITPFSQDVFVGDWVGIVKFSRDARGAITGFTLSRDNVRGVRFEKAE